MKKIINESFLFIIKSILLLKIKKKKKQQLSETQNAIIISLIDGEGHVFEIVLDVEEYKEVLFLCVQKINNVMY
jgi:hypothetical protein